MKGQNFRLFINGGQRIAGALSCNIETDIETESESTKDLEGDFDRVGVVSQQATITAEAAYALDANVSHRETVFASTPVTVDDRQVYPDSNNVFNLHMGDIVQVNTICQTVLLIDEDGDVLTELTQDDPAFESDSDYNGCYLAVETSGATNEFFDVVDGGILFEAVNEGLELLFSFCPTAGDKNAEIIDAAIVSGQCVITKRTLRSTNKQRAVWSLTAVSNGEFTTEAPSA